MTGVEEIATNSHRSERTNEDFGANFGQNLNFNQFESAKAQQAQQNNYGFVTSQTVTDLHRKVRDLELKIIDIRG